MTSIDDLLKKKERMQERVLQMEQLLRDKKKHEEKKILKIISKAIIKMQDDSSFDKLIEIVDKFITKPSEREFLKLKPIEKGDDHV